MSVEDTLFPPWEPDQAETLVPDSGLFKSCDNVVAVLSERMKGNIVKRVYSTSAKWGKILRVDMLAKKKVGDTNFLVTCWEDPDSKVRFFVKIG